MNAYDARGRVVTETTVIDSAAFTTTYTYDALDRVASTTYPDGEVITTTYTLASQPHYLNTSLQATAYVTAATYNALGALTALTFGNGLTTNYDYFADAGEALSFRLERVTVGNGLLDLSYAYDNVGNVTVITDVSGSRNETLAFDYDALDRLIAVSAGEAPRRD